MPTGFQDEAGRFQTLYCPPKSFTHPYHLREGIGEDFPRWAGKRRMGARYPHRPFLFHIDLFRFKMLAGILNVHLLLKEELHQVPVQLPIFHHKVEDLDHL